MSFCCFLCFVTVSIIVLTVHPWVPAPSEKQLELNCSSLINILLKYTLSVSLDKSFTYDVGTNSTLSGDKSICYFNLQLVLTPYLNLYRWPFKAFVTGDSTGCWRPCLAINKHKRTQDLGLHGWCVNTVVNVLLFPKWLKSFSEFRIF